MTRAVGECKKCQVRCQDYWRKRKDQRFNDIRSHAMGPSHQDTISHCTCDFKTQQGQDWSKGTSWSSTRIKARESWYYLILQRPYFQASKNPLTSSSNGSWPELSTRTTLMLGYSFCSLSAAIPSSRTTLSLEPYIITTFVFGRLETFVNSSPSLNA